jgi:hypothetical protein
LGKVSYFLAFIRKSPTQKTIYWCPALGQGLLFISLRDLKGAYFFQLMLAALGPLALQAVKKALAGQKDDTEEPER